MAEEVWSRELFLGNRDESLYAEILDGQDRATGEVKHLESFKISGGWMDEIRTGGTMTLQDADGVDWLTNRFKLYYVVNGVRFAQGIYLPGTPSGKRLSGDQHRTVEFYDRTMVLHQDQLTEHRFVEKDVHVLTHVMAEIRATGERLPAQPQCIQRTNHSVTWKPGTTRLRMIHDMLQAAGYRNLAVNREGDYVIRRNRPEVTDAPVWVFRDNEYEGLYLDGFSDDVDLFEVPNQWIGWSRTDGEEPGLYSVQRNEDPDDPLSIPRRGRVISRSTEDVEATSQAVLDRIIRRNLSDAISATREIVFEHPWVPMELEDIVEFHNTEHDIHVKARVTHYEQNFGVPGALCKTTVRVAKQI